MNLALFDFDGTVTNKDTFTRFMFYAVSKRRLLLGHVLVLPYVVRYKMGILHGSKVRQKMCQLAFKNKSEQELRQKGDSYAKKKLPSYIRTEAKNRIAWHKAQGDRVVLVSASLDLYLKVWCENNDIELICTQLEAKNGKLTGGFLGGDCSSEEKSRRVLSNFDLADYDKVYAYGDTVEDNELLQLADEQYYQYF